jgi:hypothetical protein
MKRSNKALSLLSSIGNNNVLSSATSCYPTYNSSGSYTNGDWVSSALSSSLVKDVLFGWRSLIIQDKDVIVCLSPSMGDCPESGLKEREGGLFHEITEVYNYQCISDDLCSNNKVEAPHGSINSGHVWAAESDPCMSSVSIII